MELDNHLDARNLVEKSSENVAGSTKAISNDVVQLVQELTSNSNHVLAKDVLLEEDTDYLKLEINQEFKNSFECDICGKDFNVIFKDFFVIKIIIF